MIAPYGMAFLVALNFATPNGMVESTAGEIYPVTKCQEIVQTYKSFGREARCAKTIPAQKFFIGVNEVWNNDTTKIFLPND